MNQTVMSSQQALAAPTSILRLPEVRRRTGLSRSAIYAGMARGTFPQNISLGPQTAGWVDAEVEAWVLSRIAASRP